MSLGAGGDRVVRMMLFHMLQRTVKCPLHAVSSAEPVFPENIAGTLGALLSIAKHGRSGIKEWRVIWAYSFWCADHPGREGMAAEATLSLAVRAWATADSYLSKASSREFWSSCLQGLSPRKTLLQARNSLDDFTASPDSTSRWGASAQTLESTEYISHSSLNSLEARQTLFLIIKKWGRSAGQLQKPVIHHSNQTCTTTQRHWPVLYRRNKTF